MKSKQNNPSNQIQNTRIIIKTKRQQNVFLNKTKAQK